MHDKLHVRDGSLSQILVEFEHRRRFRCLCVALRTGQNVVAVERPAFSYTYTVANAETPPCYLHVIDVAGTRCVQRARLSISYQCWPRVKHSPVVFSESPSVWHDVLGVARKPALGGRLLDRSQTARGVNDSHLNAHVCTKRGPFPNARDGSLSRTFRLVSRRHALSFLKRANKRGNIRYPYPPADAASSSLFFVCLGVYVRHYRQRGISNIKLREEVRKTSPSPFLSAGKEKVKWWQC